MELYNLKKPEGLKKKKIVGRGNASGTGKTSGKGHKGQKSRSGGGVRRGFEGGQMPLNRRIPKRGFHNKWAKKVNEINIKYLVELEAGTIVDVEKIKELGLYKSKCDYIKVIGNAELKNSITIKAHKFSKGAKEAIEKAGGKIEEIKIDKQST